MPKVEGTRAQRAAQLMARVNNGPSFHLFPGDFQELSPDHRTLIEIEVSAQYRRWADSWLKEDILSLVPELRRK